MTLISAKYSKRNENLIIFHKSVAFYKIIFYFYEKSGIKELVGEKQKCWQFNV